MCFKNHLHDSSAKARNIIRKNTAGVDSAKKSLCAAAVKKKNMRDPMIFCYARLQSRAISVKAGANAIISDAGHTAHERIMSGL